MRVLITDGHNKQERRDVMALVRSQWGTLMREEASEGTSRRLLRVKCEYS